MTTIEDALTLAALAHRDQVDQTGHPYVYHLMRVVGYAPEEFRIAAMLHDVLEDTEETLDSLEAWDINWDDRKIIELVSRLNGETYEEFITTIVESGNRGAVEVKMADLRDHLHNPNPFPITPQKYLVAYERLNDELIRQRWAS